MKLRRNGRSMETQFAYIKIQSIEMLLSLVCTTGIIWGNFNITRFDFALRFLFHQLMGEIVFFDTFPMSLTYSYREPLILVMALEPEGASQPCPACNKVDCRTPSP